MTQVSFSRRALRAALLAGGTVAGMQGGAAIAQTATVKPQVVVRFTGQDAQGLPVGASPGKDVRVTPVVGGDGRLYAATAGSAATFYAPVSGRFINLKTDGTDFRQVEYADGNVTFVGSPMTVSANGTVYGSSGVRPFRVDANGVPTPFTILDTTGAAVSVGTFLTGVASDTRGNVYYATRNGTKPQIWRMNANQQFALIADFALTDYVTVRKVGTREIIDTYLKGQNTVALAWSDSDGALYGVTAESGGKSGVAANVPTGNTPVGTIYRIKADGFKADGTSPIDVLHTFASVRDGAPLEVSYRAAGLAVVGDWIYGVSRKIGNDTSTAAAVNGRVWRIRKDCVSTAATNCLEIVHRFDTEGIVADARGGAAPIGNFVLAADGNLYGTTLLNATRTTTDGKANGGGSLYRIENPQATALADVKFVALHNFDLVADGAYPGGLTLGAKANGVQKLYGATAAGGDAANVFADQAVSSADGNGTLFSLDIALPAALINAFAVSSGSATNIPAASKVTLAWQSTGAAQCSATGDWAGAKQASGSEEVGPLAYRAAGYVYGLVCTSADGAASPASMVVVSVAAPVVQTPSDSGGGGAFSGLGALLLALGLAGRGLVARRRTAV